MFEELIPDLQAPAREILSAAGQARLQPRVTSTMRTHTQQVRLYRRWLAGQSPFPAAPPGLSAHEYGFAFDMVVTPMQALADVGYTWLDWGGVWSPKDPIHFEYPGFVAPPQEENIVQTAARKLSELPWYVQLLTPGWSLTKEVTPADQAALAAKACRFFGIGCSKP